MSMRRMAVLQAGLLLVAMFANATSRNNAIRIKVLDSETRSVEPWRQRRSQELRPGHF